MRCLPLCLTSLIQLRNRGNLSDVRRTASLAASISRLPRPSITVTRTFLVLPKLESASISDNGLSGSGIRLISELFNLESPFGSATFSGASPFPFFPSRQRICTPPAFGVIGSGAKQSPVGAHGMRPTEGGRRPPLQGRGLPSSVPRDSASRNAIDRHPARSARRPVPARGKSATCGLPSKQCRFILVPTPGPSK